MKDILWKKFENTGSIEAYLAYSRAKLRKECDCHGKDDNNGNCTFGHSGE